MTRQHYRISNEFEWVSNSGTALMAMFNLVGSGKKVTIGSLEILNSSVTTGATVAGALATTLTLSRCTVTDGDSVAVVSMDSEALVWPATVQVLKRAAISSSTRICRVSVLKQCTNTISWAAMQRPYGIGRLVKMPRSVSTGVEGIIIRQGESVALHADFVNNSMPVKVTATFVRTGSPNRTFTATYFTNIKTVNTAIFAIVNGSGSGEIITIRSIAIEEVGTFDSPYFQLVPVGSIESASSSDIFRDVTYKAIKMDSNYADPSQYVRIYQDAVVYPYNMPENAFSDASSGSPRGFSYLKTKDFQGPVYRTLFPEQVSRTSTGASDYAGHHISHRYSDVFGRRSGITIREGESIALVSAAETAAGATAAVGVSGWSSFDIAMNFVIEPKIYPTITLTGLKNPSEVRVFNDIGMVEIAGQENVTSGTFSFQYDPDIVASITIVVLSLGYINIRFQLALSLSDTTIPIQQQIDRQYSNT